MANDNTMETLKNHFLIAMPNLDDRYFKRSVVYVCEHDSEGAMGLVVNVPVDLSVQSLLEQIDSSSDEILASPKLSEPVYQGGPIAQERGFVLHTPQKGYSSSLMLSDTLMVTTSKDILQVLGTDNEPKDYLVTLGYAGWEAGQLEKEIAENAWLILPANTDILFDVPTHLRWESAAQQLGVNIWQVSSQIGHA